VLLGVLEVREDELHVLPEDGEGRGLSLGPLGVPSSGLPAVASDLSVSSVGGLGGDGVDGVQGGGCGSGAWGR
jgi:hypothetical protein